MDKIKNERKGKAKTSHAKKKQRMSQLKANLDDHNRKLE